MQKAAPCELTAIVVARNDEARIGSCLAALAEAATVMTAETIVVDGGSTDATRAKADAAGAITIDGVEGRGRQLNAGAKAARGRWLLFLHAGTVLEPYWSTTAQTFMGVRSNLLRAGYFKVALDAPGGAARRVERLANWRARTFGLPYGDQGLLMSRTLYESLGGYADAPVMEDVEIVRRIGKEKLVELPATATVSAASYRAGGYALRPLRNLSLLGLYFLGVPPHNLAKIYR